MNPKRAVLILVFILCVAALSLINALASQTQNLQVSFINVGQGDSALLRDDTGFDILIDGGRTSAGPTVVAYLREQGVDDIDVMVVSHADSDHVGGLIDVLEIDDIPVQQVLYNGYLGDTDTWHVFETAVANEGLALSPAQFPITYTWGSTTAQILNPAPGLVNPETNDASVVILLEYGANHFLFTGDIDSTIEATVVARGTPIAAEILKVGHHGSAYSSSAAFLSAVQPKEAVISVGTNSYGHPDDDTLARLTAAGARIWRTDKFGTIVVLSDGTSYSVLLDYSLYLPYVVYEIQTPVNTPTPTPTTPVPPTPQPTSTPTPTPTEGPATSGNVQIINIFFDGAGSQEPDEHVDIRNDDTRIIQLQNWTLRDNENHVYTFPSFLMQPSQECRIYTNQSHPEWCGFNYGSGSAIWNNSGDCAYLRDEQGNPIDEYCYE